MDKKKSKLTISGIAKKSIESIEKAKTQSKNSVVIEKKLNKFSPKRIILDKNDDGQVNVNGKEVLQRNLNNIKSWAEKWKMEFNVDSYALCI